jgi:hypothetical protein
MEQNYYIVVVYMSMYVYTICIVHAKSDDKKPKAAWFVHPGAELGGGRRGFIPGRKITERVIFVIINN